MFLVIASATALEGCTDCSFAWDIGLGDATVTTETENGCDEFEALSGTNLKVGQGNESVGSYGGIDYFNLYSQAEDTWAVLANGYSSIKNETLWSFGSK